MPALRFKTCRLLSGNVWNRKLTIIQRRILGRLRNKKRSIKRKIYSRKNLNSYIQLQTTRKLSLFYTEVRMGRGKGNPISGRRYLNRSSDWRKEFISIIILITIYHFFFFLASLDFNLFFEGVQSKLARKYLGCLFRQLGWRDILPIFWFLLDPENMMAPAGGEGGSSSGASQGWTSVLGSSSGASSEASVNQPHPVPSNPSPSVPPAQDTHVGNPPAPLIPFLQEEGERGDLLRRLHRLVSAQLQHYCERDLPAWRQSPDNAPFLEAGAFIIRDDLEIETETIPDIREWIDRLERDPNLMREIYLPYKAKRLW